MFFCHGSGGNKDLWRKQWQVLVPSGGLAQARTWRQRQTKATRSL
ncbi:hypothetical protein PSCICN_08110 [Pseudomonas cichorii]|nr:hypothetical protein PSCICN_08110 [Pseudomonas cichorii]